VEYVGKESFTYCQTLASLTFAENSQLESIGANAFRSTIFTSVEIPNSVSLGITHALQNNNTLPTVTIPCSGEPLAIGPAAFDNMPTENAEF